VTRFASAPTKRSPLSRWWWIGTLWFACGMSTAAGLLRYFGDPTASDRSIVTVLILTATAWLVGFAAGEFSWRMRGDRELDGMLERATREIERTSRLQAGYLAWLRGEPGAPQSYLDPKDLH